MMAMLGHAIHALDPGSPRSNPFQASASSPAASGANQRMP